MAGHMGFRSGFGNALEYGGDDPFANNRGNRNYADRPVYHQARGLGRPDQAEARGLGYVDEGRRGHFIPT